MRRAFIETLVELAARDERIFLLTADLGYMALESFADAFPERFVNVGVAEQNMVGIATGLAESGYLPFVYSIATFAALRPYEFIRNGPVSHKLPVRVIGVGGGFEYSHNGLSHFALEDIAVMRTQPALRVVAPADAPQTRTALEKTWNLEGPVYYRLGKDEKARVPGLNSAFSLDDVDIVKEGADCLVISTGGISCEAAEAVALASTKSVDCAHAVLSSLSPLPMAALKRLLQNYRSVVSVEAHYARGGLFSLASEVVAEHDLNCRIFRCAVEEMPDGVTGDLPFMYEKNGLSPGCIADKIVLAAQHGRSTCLTR